MMTDLDRVLESLNSFDDWSLDVRPVACGGGDSRFCARLLDSRGDPLTNYVDWETAIAGYGATEDAAVADLTALALAELKAFGDAEYPGSGFLA